MEDSAAEDISGPPASNLRKKSGGNIPVENTMAGLSDKMTASIKKLKTKMKGTPSVKEWFGSTDDKSHLESAEERIEKESDINADNESDTDDLQENRRHQAGEYWDNFDTGEWSERRNPPPQQQQNIPENENEVDAFPIRDETQNGTQNEPRNILQRKVEIDFDKLTPEEMKDLLRVMFEVLREMQSTEDRRKKSDAINLKKVKDNEDRIKLTTKAIIKHDREIQNVTSRINQADIKECRNNILIAGIPETKSEKCKDVIEKFFKEVLKISEMPTVIRAHRIGKADTDNRQMVVYMADLKDKIKVYKHAKNLKDVKNPEGKGYYISDQLPPIQEEEQRLRKFKIQNNQKLIPAQQQSLQWKKGQLLVDGNTYNPKARQPSCTEILEMKPVQLKQALAKKLYPGDTVSKDNSTFTGYSAKCYSIQQVLDGYRQLKYRFLESTHIICAYRIMDPDVAHMVDCVDDGELGAGRRLLEMLIENSYENTVVYIVRHHRGPNKGPIRFSMITDAGKSAIEKMPEDINQLIKHGSSLQPNFSFHYNQTSATQNRKATPATIQRGSLATRTRRTRGSHTAAKTLNFGERRTPKAGSYAGGSDNSNREEQLEAHADISLRGKYPVQSVQV